jgi:hypothetical protein
MQSQDFERCEWLGVFGAGLIAAAITALAMPWHAHSESPVVIESSHVVRADMPTGEDAEE